MLLDTYGGKDNLWMDAIAHVTAGGWRNAVGSFSHQEHRALMTALTERSAAHGRFSPASCLQHDFS